MKSSQRVVITGLGMVSPVGNTVPVAWQNIVAGGSGVDYITQFDTTDYPVKIAACVKGFDPSPWLSGKDTRRMDWFIQYGVVAAIEAITDAGLPEYTNLNLERVGVAIGSGIGGLPIIEKSHATLVESGARKVSPFFVPSAIINMIAGHVSIRYGYRGPNIAITTACTTGAHNIGFGARMIAYGEADVVVVGGAEMATCPLGVAGFASAKALSTRNDEPSKASRPWDKDRDGFVLGDGAGVLVLESLEHAQARGAKIYAELIGFGMSADAHHITAPSEGGEGAASAMRLALKDAAISLEAVDYINAHGTSTQAGDLAETHAIKSVFGEHAASRLMVSSTKSMTGHLLGAAGAIEAIFSVLSIQDGVVPPTVNLDVPDVGCDLDYVPHEARQCSIQVAMSNSFGFGGTNGCLIFRRL